jgi:guanylate kinase
MVEQEYQGDYRDVVSGPKQGGVSPAEARVPGVSQGGNTGVTAQMLAGLSEEKLAKIVEAAGPVPVIEEFVKRPAPPLLLVLTGPSGVGKDVTLQRMEERGVPMHYVVTVTTRKQRPGEIDGKHYFFVSQEEYNRMLENEELLEHAEVYGNCYGIPKSQVVAYLRNGEDVIMKPDVQGAAHVREIEPEAVSIFLAPPSMEELVRRLYYRKTEDPQELQRRLDVAAEEMQQLTLFDYVVVNHSNRLDDTVDKIVAIMQAEKLKVRPRKIRLAE